MNAFFHRLPPRWVLCLFLAGTVAAALTACDRAPTAGASSPAAPHVEAASPVEAGRYLVAVGACNDCHTPGWENDGQVPEADWLVGSDVGWRGPWGTTYPSNLRLVVQSMAEDAFVEVLRSRKARPPMPWMNVNRLSEADARAIYRFVHSLGPKGEPMPVAVGPDEEPTTPYFDLTPRQPARLGEAHSPGAGTRTP